MEKLIKDYLFDQLNEIENKITILKVNKYKIEDYNEKLYKTKYWTHSNEIVEELKHTFFMIRDNKLLISKITKEISEMKRKHNKIVLLYKDC